LPPLRSWVEDGTLFSGVSVSNSRLKETPLTLERFLASRG
jgi:hypothetical protein